jgi:tetratricopeptide (TPR) repeat protein
MDSSEGSRSGRWLFGPLADLLLGCGLGYVAWVLLLFLWSPQMARLGPWLPLLVLVTGVPHYGATLLRITASKDDRRRFAGPALLLGALFLCAFVAGLSAPRFGAWLITAYLSLSPWHYAAQNYGITMLFLRRRGIKVGAGSRRLLRTSFMASYLLVLFSYHQIGAGGGNDPLYASSGAFRFVPLGVPREVIRLAAPLLVLIHLGSLALALRSFLRDSTLARLGPALGLLLSQCLWFTLPAAMMLFPRGHYPSHHAALAFVWIAVGHSVQYLWITTYYQRAALRLPASGKAGSGFLFLLRATLVGAALWFVPTLVFAPGAPGALGHVPFDAGLGLLVAAAVNLHHFALDGMIWRLRDPRSGTLLADQRSSDPSAPVQPLPARSGPPSLATCALVTIGGLSIFAWIATTWEREIGYRRAYAAKDVARLELASQRLAALGRDGPQIHLALGRLMARQGRTDEAVREFRRSLALTPTPAAWLGLGRIHHQRGELAEAAAAYRAALAIDPGHDEARRSYELLPLPAQ